MKLASAAAVAMALTVSAAASPATALGAAPVVTSIRLEDGRGDTWAFSDVSGYEPGVQPAADVLRARVRHGPSGVGVRMVFDDLQQRGNRWFFCEIHTPGVTYWFEVDADKYRPRGIAYQQIEGELVRVPGLAHHIDYDSDVVTLRVARSLLGDPLWVRVRLHNQLGLRDGTFFTDNPTTTGPEALFTARLRHPS
jgi:hypothetical protein